MVLRWLCDKNFPLPAMKAFQFRFTRGHGHRDAQQRGLALPKIACRRSWCDVGLKRNPREIHVSQWWLRLKSQPGSRLQMQEANGPDFSSVREGTPEMQGVH